MFVFTPPHCEMGVGSIVVRERPTSSITPHEYRMMLGDRIQAMVSDAGPEEAEPLLRDLEAQEGLNLTRDLSRVGELLAEYSPTLREMAAYPVEPIAPEQFEEDAETAEAVANEILPDWVMMLLR